MQATRRHSLRAVTFAAAVILTWGLALTGCGNEDGASDSVAGPAGSVGAELTAAGGNGRGSLEDRLARLTEALDLTDEQQTAVAAAMQTMHESHQAIREQVQAGSLSREEARQQRDALRDTFQATMADVLDDEQEALLEALRAEYGPGGRRGPDLDALADELELTDEQRTALETLFDAPRTAMQALRQEVQSGNLDREAARLRAEELRTAHHAELATILTAEQLAELEALRDARGAADGPRRDGRAGRGGGFGGGGSRL